MATTIETTNVVTRFVTEYDSASARRAASEAQRIGDRIDGSFDKAATEAKQSFNKIERESKSSLSKVERNFKGTENRLTTLFKGLGTRLAAVGIGAVIGQTINKAIQAAGSFETLSQSFKILTGDVETANALIKELNDFSLVTPFTPEQVNVAARTLLGFGRSAGEVTEDLRILGNAAAAVNAPLEQVALVYSQVAGLGKLQANDAIQFITAGIPIYELLSTSLGKSTAELKKMQEQGAITFEMLKKAFEDASEEGGKFFNAMIEQATTFAGLRSTFQGYVNEVLRSIGDLLLPAAKRFLTTLIGVTSGFASFVRTNSGSIRDFLGQITQGFANAFRPVIDALKGFFETIKSDIPAITIFETILNRIVSTFAFFANLAGSVINGLTFILNKIKDINGESNILSNVFKTFTDLFLNLPLILNGTLEVIKTFLNKVVLQWENDITRIKLLYDEVKNFFGANNELDIQIRKASIENKQAFIDGLNYSDAFQKGVDEARSSIKFDIDENEAKEQGKKLGKNISDGVVEEITGGTKDVASAAGSLKFLQEQLSQLNKEIENTPTDSPYFEGMILGAKELESQISIVQARIDKLKSGGFNDIIDTSIIGESDNTQQLLQLEAQIQREIIEEQIRLNNELASNVKLTEDQKEQAVTLSTERQLQLQLRLLQIKKSLLENNGGSAAEILEIEKSISELNVQISELFKNNTSLSGFDSLLQTLFPKGDIEGIKSELSDLYSELLNLANGYIQQREEILNNEVQAAEDRVNSILNLSENASQQQLDFEKNRLEQSQKARDAFSKKQQAAAKIEAAANIVAALARIAAETGVTSFATLPAFIALFSGLAAAAVQIFHEGTESVGDGKGSRVSDKGLKQNEVLAILEKDERVIDKKLNKQLAGMSNKDLVKNALIGKNIQRAGIAPGVINLFTQNAAQSSELREIRKALQSVEATIKGLKIEANQNIDGDGVHQLVSMEMKKKVNQIKRIR